MKKILTFLYQWLIALPIVVVITLFTAVYSIILFPFKNCKFVHGEQRLWSKLMVWLFWANVTVEGLENIEKGKSYVFVANHGSAFDTWAIYGWLPVVFKWIMKAELRKIPFVGLACKMTGHIFIERTHPKAAAQSLALAKKTLQNGVCMVIFPEGTRSKDGNVGEFKRGAFQIAFELGLPVVPLSLSGPYDMFPKGASLVNLGKSLKMVIGKPVDLKQYEKADPADTKAVREERAQAMEEIRQMVIANKEW